METYITLGSYTQQGIANIKESPARIEAARQAIEGSGGKFLGFYLTMGRYDFVLISQSPDSETVAKITLAFGAQGNVRTETLRAFGEEEFKGLVAGMP